MEYLLLVVMNVCGNWLKYTRVSTNYQNYVCYKYICYMDFEDKSILGGRVHPVKKSMWTPSTTVHARLHHCIFGGLRYTFSAYRPTCRTADLITIGCRHK